MAFAASGRRPARTSSSASLMAACTTLARPVEAVGELLQHPELAQLGVRLVLPAAPAAVVMEVVRPPAVLELLVAALRPAEIVGEDVLAHLGAKRTVARAPVSGGRKKSGRARLPASTRPRLRAALLRWYDGQARDLPWRRTRRPVRHLGERGDAPADAGLGRAPLLDAPSSPGSPTSARSPGPASTRCSPLARARLLRPRAEPPPRRAGRGRAARRTPPGRRGRAPRSSPGSAATPWARSPPSPSGGRSPWWTATWPACSRACSASRAPPATQPARSGCGRWPGPWWRVSARATGTRR